MGALTLRFIKKVLLIFVISFPLFVLSIENDCSTPDVDSSFTRIDFKQFVKDFNSLEKYGAKGELFPLDDILTNTDISIRTLGPLFLIRSLPDLVKLNNCNLEKIKFFLNEIKSEDFSKVSYQYARGLKEMVQGKANFVIIPAFTSGASGSTRIVNFGEHYYEEFLSRNYDDPEKYLKSMSNYFEQVLLLNKLYYKNMNILNSFSALKLKPLVLVELSGYRPRQLTIEHEYKHVLDGSFYLQLISKLVGLDKKYGLVRSKDIRDLIFYLMEFRAYWDSGVGRDGVVSFKEVQRLLYSKRKATNRFLNENSGEVVKHLCTILRTGSGLKKESDIKSFMEYFPGCS